MSIQWDKELYHYGMPRRSGRYKWGSGEDPYHHGASAPSRRTKRLEKKTAYAKRARAMNRREASIGDHPRLDKISSKAADVWDKKADKYGRKLAESKERDEARASKENAKFERKEAIAKGKEQLKSKSRLERKAMLAEAQANVQRQAANNVNNPLRALNKSNANYYSKKAEKYNAKIERKGYEAKKKEAKKQYRAEYRKKTENDRDKIYEELNNHRKRRELNNQMGAVFGDSYKNTFGAWNERNNDKQLARNTEAARENIRNANRERKKKTLQSNIRYDKKIYGENSRKVRRGKKKLAKYR